MKSAEQIAADQKQREGESKSGASGGIGGIASGIMRRAAQKKMEGDPKSRTTIMTGTTEVLKVVTDVTPAGWTVKLLPIPPVLPIQPPCSRCASTPHPSPA